jgi:hypothetical protein
MRYQWQHLNRQQVGAFSEYFVQMELTMHGFQVYTSEVDDRGIDFVTRYENGPFLSVQVKSIRKSGYVFVRKEHFSLSPELVLALAILNDCQEPELFLIPSLAWKYPDTLLVDRNYEGKKSAPEWGLNLSLRNMALLNKYSFSSMVGNYRANAV